MICEKCKHEISARAKFCPHCGAPIMQSNTIVPSAEKTLPKIFHSKEKVLIILAVIVVFAIFVISKFWNNGKSKLVGTWVLESDKETTISFYDDGTYYDEHGYILEYDIGGNWKDVGNNTLYVSGMYSGDGNVEYKLTGNTLIIYEDNWLYDYYTFNRK